jgi:hypothetical protein
MKRSSYCLFFLFYGGVVSKYLTRLTSKGAGKEKKERKQEDFLFCWREKRRWE